MRSIELFAGAGGMALGLEKAGFANVALNEIDDRACQTIRYNKPSWNLLQGDIVKYKFSEYYARVPLVTGGFPCQAFSHSGRRLGFDDIRGTLFYQFVRVVNEVRPIICMGENVKGLITHDNGRTLTTIVNVLSELGYTVRYKLLNALNYGVPQKRERIFIIGVRKQIPFKYSWPDQVDLNLTLSDALKPGKLYNSVCPKSIGLRYNQKLKDVMSRVPPGGNWTDLPSIIQRQYLGKSFHQGGGKTGVARRLSWNEPSLTLLTHPSRKQTERCHPDETRPLTVREYARIQTFPDDYKFAGTMLQQYKQIGNAVPPNLAYYLGLSIMSLLQKINKDGLYNSYFSMGE